MEYIKLKVFTFEVVLLWLLSDGRFSNAQKPSEFWIYYKTYANIGGSEMMTTDLPALDGATKPVTGLIMLETASQTSLTSENNTKLPLTDVYLPPNESDKESSGAVTKDAIKAVDSASDEKKESEQPKVQIKEMNDASESEEEEESVKPKIESRLPDIIPTTTQKPKEFVDTTDSDEEDDVDKSKIVTKPLETTTVASIPVLRMDIDNKSESSEEEESATIKSIAEMKPLVDVKSKYESKSAEESESDEKEMDKVDEKPQTKDNATKINDSQSELNKNMIASQLPKVVEMVSPALSTLSNETKANTTEDDSKLNETASNLVSASDLETTNTREYAFKASTDDKETSDTSGSSTAKKNFHFTVTLPADQSIKSLTVVFKGTNVEAQSRKARCHLMQPIFAKPLITSSNRMGRSFSCFEV